MHKITKKGMEMELFSMLYLKTQAHKYGESQENVDMSLHVSKGASFLQGSYVYPNFTNFEYQSNNF